MKVAIMGAGLSGLSCAIILERNGIPFDIFEKREEVGDRFINGEALLSILYRPVMDPIKYLAEEFQIYLKPTSHISQMDIRSKNEIATIEEQLGFINIRGRHDFSWEKQLAEQINKPIHFHSEYTYEELEREYTHVILATGDASYAKKLGNFSEEYSVSLRGATVEGKFNRSHVAVWLNNELAPKGYGYMLPFSDTEANVVIGYPNLPSDSIETGDLFWKRFLKQAQKDLNQSLKITDQFQVHNYQMGICKKARIGNTFFSGNNFGAIMPFIGFGQFDSILTGVYAAYDICGLGDYEKLTQHIRRSYYHSITLRKATEKLDNEKFNMIVRNMDRKLVDKIFKPSRQNVLRLASFMIRPFIRE